MATQPSASVSSIYQQQEAVIISGSDTSNAIKVYGSTAVQLIVPANIVGEYLTYLVSCDDVEYLPLTDPDLGQSVMSILNGTDKQALSLNPAKFFGWTSIKIVSDGNQIADKTFIIVPKAI